ncbi:DeoR/GlpR family DNA-binding transcription regulator [Thermoanaerobacterium thermosaccharolyticum]|uniref:DeoR/GlpR family DNA-binding transcription regulator n=1 Tax=Thermoanaerobacterium thermosaccharolyticum TaxID=1517 RepID=UPI0020A5EF7D|nr:DeoR/GlpR family DNA-binding transcription regulator [Thermoanaerobacterium thermosaccharolyticum]MCP2240304.1 DeoR/GlpR family transcriptional regulator of sugar metabolism [Thermoanaerobacterium thermosaccharolyticum]
MLAIERRKRIMRLIQENQSVLVPELSKLFNVTEETIRRDLEKLEAEGLLKRTYGGAVINENSSADIPLNIREITNIESKQAISMKVAEYIEDGDTLLLDSSSTVLQVAKQIKFKKKLTVITNSEKIILELANAKDCKVISTGGVLKQNSMSLIGNFAEDMIKNFCVDKAIISSKGFDMTNGITESNEMEAEVKKAMADSAEKVFLLLDHNKFDKSSFVKMFDLNKIDYLFTDRKLSLEWEEFLKKHNIDLIYC